MPKKTKKFIDRKNAVTFHLVHRSQQDPLIADELAPQRVLVPVSQKASKDKQKQIEEQHKYGIFFDDDYNYLQHLKDANATTEWIPVESKSNAQSKLELPSSVFPSNVEEEIGLLNKAAPHSGPRLDLDPDVVAAMDDDFNFDDPENHLEDNFIQLANEVCSENEDEDYESDVNSEYCSSEDLDEIASLDGHQFTFNNEETKSHFTDYSMSSSVIRRNDQLTFLDDKFEEIYAKYDNSDIGALDCEEIEGFVPESSNVLFQYAEEFEKERQREKLDKSTIAFNIQEECDNNNDENLVFLKVPEKEKWDCESILSTYSNIYNFPKLIKEPKHSKININTNAGMPVDVFNSGKLTAKALAQLNDENSIKAVESITAKSIISTLSTLSIRPKNESPQERKERKRMLKEYRKERRQEKKINTLVFKDELKRQAKIAMNERNNIQGNKIL